MYRADDIKNLIKDESYPYSIQFATQEILPSQRVYPYVEIINVKPGGERKSYDVTEETNTFEVRVYARYNRAMEKETEDLGIVEGTIMNTLKSATLSDKLEITSNFEWSRGEIKRNPYKIHGVQSILTVSIVEKKSTSGDGTFGGSTTISIGDMTELAGMPVLGISGPDGKNYSEDTPGSQRILTENNPNGSLSVEIEMTAAVLPKLKEIFGADDEIQVKINEGGLIDMIAAYPVSIERIVKYDDINRRVLHFELV